MAASCFCEYNNYIENRTAAAARHSLSLSTSQFARSGAEIVVCFRIVHPILHRTTICVVGVPPQCHVLTFGCDEFEVKCSYATASVVSVPLIRPTQLRGTGTRFKTDAWTLIQPPDAF